MGRHIYTCKIEYTCLQIFRYVQQNTTIKTDKKLERAHSQFTLTKICLFSTVPPSSWHWQYYPLNANVDLHMQNLSKFIGWTPYPYPPSCQRKLWMSPNTKVNNNKHNWQVGDKQKDVKRTFYCLVLIIYIVFYKPCGHIFGLFDLPPPFETILLNKAYVVIWTISTPTMATWFMNDP